MPGPQIAYAIRLYSDAIDLKRDQKAYYCNRALAYLRQRPTPDWQAALKDCNTVVDVWEIFDASDVRLRAPGSTLFVLFPLRASHSPF